MKRAFSIVLIAVILAISIPVNSMAEKYDFQFEDVYQKPWYKSKYALYGGAIAGAIAVGAITYFTAGTGTAASAGPLATWIGSVLGGLKGLSGIAATNAGLAMIGGGSVAGGGLGILGGVAILSGVGDLAVTIALEQAMGFMPQNKIGQPFTAIPLPTKVGTSYYRNKVDEIADLSEDPVENSQKIANLMKLLANSSFTTVDKKNRFDILISAVASFNIHEFMDAKEKIFLLNRYAESGKNGFLEYVLGRIDIAEDDSTVNINSAMQSFELCIKHDKEAIPPYLELAQLYLDQNNRPSAASILMQARKDADDENFAVNYFLASIFFNQKDYDRALDMYEEALSDITINSYEAECKAYIAICYKRMGDYKAYKKWRENAFSEVKDSKENISYISKLFNDHN